MVSLSNDVFGIHLYIVKFYLIFLSESLIALCPKHIITMYSDARVILDSSFGSHPKKLVKVKSLGSHVQY